MSGKKDMRRADLGECCAVGYEAVLTPSSHPIRRAERRGQNRFLFDVQFDDAYGSGKSTKDDLRALANDLTDVYKKQV